MSPKRRTSKAGEEKVTMVGVKSVPVSVLEKLQTIANLENVSFNEIYNTAFVKLIENYEKVNGKVKIKPKGSGLADI